MDKQIIQKSDFATYLPLNFCYACGDENYEYTHVVPKYSLDMYNTFWNKHFIEVEIMTLLYTLLYVYMHVWHSSIYVTKCNHVKIKISQYLIKKPVLFFASACALI